MELQRDRMLTTGPKV